MTEKPTQLKDAIAKWEEETGQNASDAKDIQLQFQIPPIDRMEINVLATLTACEKLSLSTNNIDKIILPPMRNLKILALGRNNIKSFTGLEPLADTLEELWISYNYIDKMKGIENMKKLRVLYISYNNFKSWNEFSKLSELRDTLRELNFVGNPLVEDMDEESYRKEAIQRLPFLDRLDGDPVIKESLY